MGKCQKYLGDLVQTFTDIRALKVMNTCQIITIYFNENKIYGPKTVVTAGTGSIIECGRHTIKQVSYKLSIQYLCDGG